LYVLLIVWYGARSEADAAPLARSVLPLVVVLRAA
jgi:hypothetical protein